MSVKEIWVESIWLTKNKGDAHLVEKACRAIYGILKSYGIACDVSAQRNMFILNAEHGFTQDGDARLIALDTVQNIGEIMEGAAGLNIYRLYGDLSGGYSPSMIVVASNEDKARDVAARNCGREGPNVWKSSQISVRKLFAKTNREGVIERNL